VALAVAQALVLVVCAASAVPLEISARASQALLPDWQSRATALPNAIACNRASIAPAAGLPCCAAPSPLALAGSPLQRPGPSMASSAATQQRAPAVGRGGCQWCMLSQRQPELPGRLPVLPIAADCRPCRPGEKERKTYRLPNKRKCGPTGAFERTYPSLHMRHARERPG